MGIRGRAPTRTWNFLYTAVSLSAMYIAASHASSVSTWNFTMARVPAAPLGCQSRHEKNRRSVKPGPSVEMPEACQARRALRSWQCRHAALPNPAPTPRSARRQGAVWQWYPPRFLRFRRITKPQTQMDGLPMIRGLLTRGLGSLSASAHRVANIRKVNETKTSATIFKRHAQVRRGVPPLPPTPRELSESR